MLDYRIYHDDCLNLLGQMKNHCIDAVVTDAPYPCIPRAYGMMSEAEWLKMMVSLVTECRRVLTPSGSAVILVQPNSSKAGSLRHWHLEFTLWAARYWNVVQDDYLINTCAMPVGSSTTKGLLRSATKWAVWIGNSDCYRDQESILLPESEGNKISRMTARHEKKHRPCGYTIDIKRSHSAAVKRGGVTPFNFFPSGNARHGTKHPAVTPLSWCERWVKYICPPGSIVLDPFCGSGTVGMAALKHGRRFVGIEQMSEYVEIAHRRIESISTDAA